MSLLILNSLLIFFYIRCFLSLSLLARSGCMLLGRAHPRLLLERLTDGCLEIEKDCVSLTWPFEVKMSSLISQYIIQDLGFYY